MMLICFSLILLLKNIILLRSNAFKSKKRYLIASLSLQLMAIS